MVLYKCEKCNKEFIQKSNYINKKIQCEIINVRSVIKNLILNQIILLILIKRFFDELNNTFDLLQNKNIILEQENKQSEL